jgi:hypothetical protein
MNPDKSNSAANTGTSHEGEAGEFSVILIPTYEFTSADGRPIAGMAQYAHRMPCLKVLIIRTVIAIPMDNHAPPAAIISPKMRL